MILAYSPKTLNETNETRNDSNAKRILKSTRKKNKSLVAFLDAHGSVVFYGHLVQDKVVPETYE